MKELADGVWHLNTFPVPNSVNAYLLAYVGAVAHAAAAIPHASVDL